MVVRKKLKQTVYCCENRAIRYLAKQFIKTKKGRAKRKETISDNRLLSVPFSLTLVPHNPAIHSCSADWG